MRVNQPAPSVPHSVPRRSRVAAARRLLLVTALTLLPPLTLPACGNPDSPPSQDGTTTEEAAVPTLSELEGQEAQVLATVERYLHAMNSNDAEVMRTVMFEDGHAFTVTLSSGDPDPDGVSTPPPATRVPHRDLFAALAEGSDRRLGRLWDPSVLIRDPIALVWVPYDFYMNEAFSHCGVDVFYLIRTDDGWKIASLLYTREQRCPPSPLGPPDRDLPRLVPVPIGAREARGPDREAALGALQGFARALETADVELARSVLIPEGVGYSTAVGDDGHVRIGRETNQEFLEWLATTTERHEERLHPGTILVRGPIAAAWVPYEYVVDGVLRHCGVNAVSLVRTPEGWKSADWHWTEETEGCDDPVEG